MGAGYAGVLWEGASGLVGEKVWVCNDWPWSVLKKFQLGTICNPGSSYKNGKFRGCAPVLSASVFSDPS